MDISKCENCGEAIDEEAFKKAECPKCGQTLGYGSQGCGG